MERRSFVKKLFGLIGVAFIPVDLLADQKKVDDPRTLDFTCKASSGSAYGIGDRIHYRSDLVGEISDYRVITFSEDR